MAAVGAWMRSFPSGREGSGRVRSGNDTRFSWRLGSNFCLDRCRGRWAQPIGSKLGMIIGPRQVPATQAIPSHENVFSGVSAPHFCCQFVLCRLRPINFGLLILDSDPISAQILKITWRCARFFRSSSSQTKFRLPLELLPTSVRLAPTTHPGERSLHIGDELAENPPVSKSRTTQIV